MKTKSLKWTVYLYLIGFSCLILVFLWTFQIIFLKYYYESYKTNELEQTLETIKLNYKYDSSNLYETLEEYAYDRGICSEITTNGVVTYTTNPTNRGCLNIYDQTNKLAIQKEKSNFLASDNEKFRLRIINKSLTNKTLVYGIKLSSESAIFINTSIDPIDSTVTILKNQFSIITFIVIVLATIVAYFISNKITGPILNLTKNSRKLSNGNFNISFDTNSSIVEINELSKSLNYTKDVMKKNDELRRDLMANVSHDLKTPLTMIKAYAEMIRDISYKDDNKRENDANVIIDEVDRLNLLVNDILNLSKLESNLDYINYEEFNLSETINTIVKRFKIFSLTESFIFIENVPENIIVYADKTKIEQVIYNLIGNAINYTSNKKKIYITVLKRKKYVRVAITDIGRGINKKDLDKIWDKYYKSDKNHKRNTIGTGLGLSIVKHILELHKFEYGVVTKENKGTTFFFEIKNKKNKNFATNK